MRTLRLSTLLLSIFALEASAQTHSDIRPGSVRCVEVSTVEIGGDIPAQGAIGGVAVDDLGRIYIATFRDSVYRIELDGTRTLLSNAFGNASGNNIDNNGELLQSDYETHQVYRVHEDGSRTLLANGLSRPVGLVMDANDDIYVVNYGDDTISRISPTGEVSVFSDDPLLNGPNGITLGSGGGMYVVNFDDNLLLRMRPDGTAEIVASVGRGSNNAHVAWLKGRLYVSTILTHEVYEVTVGGDVTRLAGTARRGTKDGCAPNEATLSFPNGIAASRHSNVLYTNNFLGIMGGPSGRIILRAIDLE